MAASAEQPMLVEGLRTPGSVAVPANQWDPVNFVAATRPQPVLEERMGTPGTVGFPLQSVQLPLHQ